MVELKIWFGWRFGWVGDLVWLKMWLGWMFGCILHLVGLEIGLGVARLVWRFGWAEWGFEIWLGLRFS